MTLPNTLAQATVPRWFWPLLIGLNFLLHLPSFQLPPVALHVWRQCNTMAVARNFYEEDMNILKPRVDRRNATDGVTGMQFPSYEWVTAAGYRVLGFHEAWPRVLNWLFYMVGVVAFYGLVKQVSGQAGAAALGAWCFAWSPELYYHGSNALPDVLALTAAIAGLYWFSRWRHNQRPLTLLLSLLAVTLAGLTKLQFLAVGFPMAVFVIRDVLQQRYSGPKIGQLLLYAVVAVGVPLAWYRYALELIQASGLADFGLEFRPAADLGTALAILSHNLVSDIPEVLLGYVPLALLVAGIWRLFRAAPTRHPWFLPGLSWGAALAAYYFIELRQMKHHTYYMLPLIPVLLLLAAWGGAWLWKLPRARGWVLVLLLLQPALTFARISWTRWLHRGPEDMPELFTPTTRATLEAATPPGALCLVGPDDSGCIAFYLLHKKGFGFDRTEQLLETTSSAKPYIAKCIAQGARYLYVRDTAVIHNQRLRPYLHQKLKQVGSFSVWSLQAAAQHPTQAPGQ
jgi:hypothetical protein